MECRKERFLFSPFHKHNSLKITDFSAVLFQFDQICILVKFNKICYHFL